MAKKTPEIIMSTVQDVPDDMDTYQGMNGTMNGTNLNTKASKTPRGKFDIPDGIRHKEYVASVMPRLRHTELANMLISNRDYFKCMPLEDIYTLLSSNDALKICLAYFKVYIDDPIALELAENLIGADVALLLMKFPSLINKRLNLESMTNNVLATMLLHVRPELIHRFESRNFESHQWAYMCIHAKDYKTVAHHIPWQNISNNELVEIVTAHPSLVKHIKLSNIDDKTYARLIIALIRDEGMGNSGSDKKIVVDWDRFISLPKNFDISIIFVYRPDLFKKYDEIHAHIDNEKTYSDTIEVADISVNNDGEI